MQMRARKGALRRGNRRVLASPCLRLNLTLTLTLTLALTKPNLNGEDLDLSQASDEVDKAPGHGDGEDKTAKCGVGGGFDETAKASSFGERDPNP